MFIKCIFRYETNKMHYIDIQSHKMKLSIIKSKKLYLIHVWDICIYSHLLSYMDQTRERVVSSHLEYTRRVVRAKVEHSKKFPAVVISNSETDQIARGRKRRIKSQFVKGTIAPRGVGESRGRRVSRARRNERVTRRRGAWTTWHYHGALFHQATTGREPGLFPPRAFCQSIKAHSPQFRTH